MACSARIRVNRPSPCFTAEPIQSARRTCQQSVNLGLQVTFLHASNDRHPRTARSGDRMAVGAEWGYSTASLIIEFNPAKLSRRIIKTPPRARRRRPVDAASVDRVDES